MREAGRSAVKPTTIIGEENKKTCRFSKLWHFWLKRLRIGKQLDMSQNHNMAKKITDKGTLAQWQDIHFSLQIKCIEQNELHKENHLKFKAQLIRG